MPERCSASALPRTLSPDLPSVITTKTGVRRLLRPLKRYRCAYDRAKPVLVPRRKYGIRSIAVMSCRFLKYLLKPNATFALEEYTTAPTCVYLREILKEATNRLTKSRQRLKLPRPEASMLPEASMTNARSILAWQTTKKYGNVY